MDIFSKRDGPRAEDVKAKRIIQQNAGTIRRLADQISNGGFSKLRAQDARRTQEPKAEGLVIHDLKAPSRDETPAPYVKVSVNNRVVLADANSGRQIQLLGEIRRAGLSRVFVLATRENGFLSPISDEMFDAIGGFEKRQISGAQSEADLAKALETALDGIKA